MTQSMSSHNVYTSAGPQVTAQQNEDEINQNNGEQLLDRLCQQALKGKSTLNDVDEAFVLMEGDNNTETGETIGDGKSAVKRLQNMGYVKDEKKWLTKKGFDAISRMILRNIMQNAKSSGVGEHMTNLMGSGEITMDMTRKYEFGDDPKN